MNQTTHSGPEYHSKLLIKRNFFTWRWKSEYSLEQVIGPGQLSELLDPIFREFLPNLTGQMQERAEISNIKGRDLGPGSIESELFFVSGTIPMLEQSEHQNTWNISANSRFKSFGAHNSTLYVVETCKDIPYAEDVYVTQIGRTWPFLPTNFRLGVELFSTTFTSSLFGALPAVSETLWIDASDKAISITIVSELLKRRSILPLKGGELFEQLNSCLRPTLGVDLMQDYKNKLLCSNGA